MLTLLTERTVGDLDDYRVAFSNATPFKHVAIDGFFAEDFVASLRRDFPQFNAAETRTESGKQGRKLVRTRMSDFGPAYAQLVAGLASPECGSFLERLTGISGLVWGGENMYGGGTHDNVDGAELDLHVDFNYNDRTGLHRRLNGFPRIKLPTDKKHLSRKSIAAYFYTKERPAHEIVGAHATLYVQRHIPKSVRPNKVLLEADYTELKHIIKKRDTFLRLKHKRETELGARINALRQQLEETQASLRAPLVGFVKQKGPLQGFFPQGLFGESFSFCFQAVKTLSTITISGRGAKSLTRDARLEVAATAQGPKLVWLKRATARQARTIPLRRDSPFTIRFELSPTLPAGSIVQLQAQASGARSYQEVGISPDACTLAGQVQEVLCED